MMFPVDLLADVSQAELERLAHNYMNNLLYSNPDSPEHLTLSDSTQVAIDISSVGSIPLYGSSDKQKILALFSPRDPSTAVALYLLDQWWTVDDILKTADPAREGAVEVETVAERIVLYILNRVIYRAKEMSSEELPFLCHGEKDNAKILWNNGEAVGFYSVKPSGSLYNPVSTRSYQLPVMDSIFVRKGHRGKGFGFQMLKDFVLSFKEDCLGLRFPLTKSMYKVCEKYLCQYPEDTDLLWEVQSIGGPNQRTNIASKIQALDLTAVSKRLLFTETTEATKKDVVMEAITTQQKEAKSMECTVEIVEEVTVLRATKVSEADVAVAGRGRSTGSKQRKMVEKITEDKSEKVIRIEDIEAETPREEQASAQQKTELHNVSDLVQTEGMFSVATEEKGDDVVDAAPEEEAATIPDKPATVQASQDLEEADVTSALTREEPQVEDNAMQDLNNPCHDSQITVENVASEIEEAECQKEDIAVLVVSEDVLEVYKEVESLIKEGKGTQIENTDKQSEERVTQHVESLLTHAASEDDEAGRTVVKAIQTVQSETLRRRSQQHLKPEEEATPQHGGRVLRGRTVMSTATPKGKYTQHSQKACGELEKEVDEVSATKVAQELAVTEGEEPEEITSIKEDAVAVEEKHQLEQLTNAEETEEQEEPGVEDTAVKGSSTELPGTADTGFTKENEHEKVTDQSETSVIQDKQEVSDDEIEEPPDIQKEEQTDEADLGVGGSASEEKADEKAMDKQMGEHHQVEQEEAVDKTEEDVSTEEVTVVEEGTIEVNVEEETEGGTESVSVMEADKEPDAVAAASETVIPNEVQDEAAVPVAEEHNGSEIPKLQKATVILVDLKTTCHHLSMKEAEETPVDGECVAPEKEQMEQIAAEEKDISSCVDELLTSDSEMLVLEEEDVGKQENSTEKSVDATAEAAPVEKGELEEDYSDKEKSEFANVDEEESKVNTVPVEERQSAVSEICADIEADIPVVDDDEENRLPAEVDEAIILEEEETPVVETRALRSGTKIVTATPRHKKTRNKKTAVEQEAENCEEEEPAVRQGRISAAATPKGELTRTCRQIQEGERESKSVEGTGGEAVEEGAVGRTEKEEENTAAVTAAADDLVQDGETDTPLPKPTTDSAILTPREEEATTSAERQQSDEMVAQLSELQRVTVVLVDLKKGHLEVQEETAAVEEGDHVAEEEEEQREETKAEENVLGSLVGIEKTLEKVVVEDSGHERAEETAKEDEAKSVVDGEEEELAVTRTRRGRMQAVKATPRRTSARSRQKTGEKEKEEASEIREEEPAVQVRVLRRGRKSIPVTQRCTTKRTHKHIQEEEEEDGEESTAEEREAEEEEEQAEEQEQMIDQEKGGILEENDATQQVENVEPEMGIEKAPTAAEEAVIQDAPEEGRADEGKTEEDVAVTTQETVKGERSTSTSEVAETAAGEIAQQNPETTQAEEIQVEETKGDEKEGNSDEKIEEKNGEEAAAQKEKSAQPEFEMEKEEAAAEASVTEQETIGEDQSAVSETCAGGQEETPNADMGKVTDEEDAPVVETRVLRSGGKAVKATPRSKTTKSQQEENEQEGTVVDSSADTDESAAETRVLRKGRRAAPATPRRKSKRARTQYQPEEEEEETTPAEQTEEEEEEAGKEEDGEKAEEEGRSMEAEMKKEKDAGGVECAAGGESAAEQMKDASAEEAAFLEKEDNSEAAVGETGTDAAETSSAEVEETNSAEGEKATVTEGSTAAAEVGSDTAIAKHEALAEDEAAMAEEEAPAVTTRTKASRRPRRQRVHRENDGEDVGGGTEAATEEEEEHKVESDLDDKKAECLADEPIEKPEEGSGGENFEISSEKGDILHLVLDSDEQVEAAGLGQEDEEGGQNMSEEEVEPIVIGARDLRGRLVPSVVITPRSKSRCSHAKVLEAEESLSDEGKSPQLAPKRSPRKRKSTELTPTRKYKRHSRV